MLVTLLADLAKSSLNAGPWCGLSRPEIRRITPGASGCVEGLQARVLVPAPPGALPLVSWCRGPSLPKQESHSEPHIPTALYQDAVPSQADSPNRSAAFGLRWSQRELFSHTAHYAEHRGGTA